MSSNLPICIYLSTIKMLASVTDLLSNLPSNIYHPKKHLEILPHSVTVNVKLSRSFYHVYLPLQIYFTILSVS